jgi:hypothetical protein
MLFEMFGNSQQIAALQAQVNAQQQVLEKDKAALAAAKASGDPNGVMAAQVQYDKDTLNNDYIVPSQQDLSAAVDDFNQWSSFALTLNNVVKPGAQQMEALQDKYNELQNQSVQLDQAARMHRRRFLDSAPQGGTGVLPHTADNLAMIAFFVGYIVLFIALWIKFVPTFQGKMIVGPIVAFLSYWMVGFGVSQFFGLRSQPIPPN